MFAPAGPPLNVLRGLAGAALGAVACQAVCQAFFLAYLACLWFAGEPDIASVSRDLFGRAVTPWTGSLIVGACAGWATAAPAGRHSFAASLTAVFFFSVPLWWLLASLASLLGWTPRRYAGTYHLLAYPWMLVILAAPPALAAAVVTAVRQRDS